MDGVEPLDQLRGVRRLESDVIRRELARGSLEPLFHGFLADQERRAISDTPNPHRVLSVRASWFSCAKSGWQHAKIILS